jgi:hypothetical protein
MGRRDFSVRRVPARHLSATEENEMTLMNWINENPSTAFAVASGLVGWLYHKARGQKADDLWETALKLGKQVLPKLMQDAKLYDDAYVRAEIRKAILAGLARLKLPENKLTLALVDEAVEHVHGELAEQVMKYHLDQYIKVSEKTVAL